MTQCHQTMSSLPEPAVAAVPAVLYRSKKSRLASRGSLALWGLFAFVLGATFWQTVGFWSFLGGVYEWRRQPIIVAERSAARNCTTLTRDRTTGRTMPRPCIAVIDGVEAQRDAAVSGRTVQTVVRLDTSPGGR